jgi:WD40 repeat protein
VPTLFAEIVGLAFLPTNQLVSSGKDKTIKIWDVGAKKAVKTIRLEGENPLQLAVSPDGKIAASMEEKKVPGEKSGATIYVWNLETGTKVGQFRRRLFYTTWKMRFLGDNRTLAISPGIYFGFWDVITGKEKLQVQDLDEFRAGAPTVDDMRVAADGTLFLLRSNGMLQLWRVKE